MTLIADVAALPPALFLRESAPVVREQQVAQRPTIVSGKLKLEANKVHFDPATNLTTLTGDVIATYEGARLSSAEAEINHDTKQGLFRKSVKLVDQLGTMTASELFIDWSDENPEAISGHAKDIILDAYEAHFEADALTLPGDGSAHLEKAWFSTDRRYYRILLDGVVIRPGEFIGAKKAVFQFGDGLKVPIPFFRVNLNPRVTGIQAPVPKIDGDFNLGYSWAQVLQLGSRSTIHLNYRGGLERVPSTNAQLIYEIAEPHRKQPQTEAEIQLQRMRAPSNTQLLPNNVDVERFTDGYFDNVIVTGRQQESNDIAKRHLIVFAGHSTNIVSSTRPEGAEELDRPYYVGVQGGGLFGGVSMTAQLRYGMVLERLSTERRQRAELMGTALSPTVSLGPNVKVGLRADVGVFTGEGVDFGWVRPMAALMARPSKEVTLGLAYFRAQEWGTALFDVDRLYSKKGLHFRVDLDFKATDISILLKYDFDRQQLYDIEVALEQVIPVITPFFSYREVPGTFAFGFKLRADNLLRALKNRDIIRTGGQ